MNVNINPGTSFINGAMLGDSLAIDPAKKPVTQLAIHNSTGQANKDGVTFDVPKPSVTANQEIVRRIMDKIFDLVSSNAKPADLPAKSVNIVMSEYNAIPLSAWPSLVMLLRLDSAGKLGDVVGKSMTEQIDAVKELRQKQTDEFNKQVKDSIEQAEKSQKAGIFQAVFSWVTAVVDLVAGALKCLAGDFVGGGMLIAAGVAGVVSAALYTAALCTDDEATKESLNKAAAIAGYVQMGLELVGLGVDIGGAIKGAAAAKGPIEAATKTALAEGAGEVLQASVKAGIGEGAQAVASAVGSVAEQVAEKVSKQVAAEVAEAVSNTVVHEGAKTVGKVLTEQLAKNLTEQAIKEMVKTGVEKAVMTAIQKGVEVTVEEISKQVLEQVGKEVGKAVAKAFVYSSGNVLKNVAGSASHAAQQVEGAVLSSQINQLAADIQASGGEQKWLQGFMEVINNVIEEQQETLGKVAKTSQDALAAAIRQSNENAMTNAFNNRG